MVTDYYSSGLVACEVAAMNPTSWSKRRTSGVSPLSTSLLWAAPAADGLEDLFVALCRPVAIMNITIGPRLTTERELRAGHRQPRPNMSTLPVHSPFRVLTTLGWDGFFRPVRALSLNCGTESVTPLMKALQQLGLL